MPRITIIFTLLNNEKITVEKETKKELDDVIFHFQSSDDAIAFTTWAAILFPRLPFQEYLSVALINEENYNPDALFSVTYPHLVWNSLGPKAKIIKKNQVENEIIDDPNDKAADRFSKRYQAMVEDSEKTIVCAKDISARLKKEDGEMILLEIQITKNNTLLKFDNMSRLGWILNEVSQTYNLKLNEGTPLGGTSGIRYSEKTLLDFLIAIINKIENSTMAYSAFLDAAEEFIDSKEIYEPKFKAPQPVKPIAKPKTTTNLSLHAQIPQTTNQKIIQPHFPRPSAPPQPQGISKEFVIKTNKGQKIKVQTWEVPLHGTAQIRLHSEADAKKVANYLTFTAIGVIPKIVELGKPSANAKIKANPIFAIDLPADALDALRVIQEISAYESDANELDENATSDDEEQKITNPNINTKFISSSLTYSLSSAPTSTPSSYNSNSISHAIPSSIPPATTKPPVHKSHPLADLLPRASIKQVTLTKDNEVSTGPATSTQSPLAEGEALCQRCDNEIQKMLDLVSVLQDRLKKDPYNPEITAFMSRVNDVSLLQLAKNIHDEIQHEDEEKKDEVTNNSSAALLAQSMGQVLKVPGTSAPLGLVESNPVDHDQAAQNAPSLTGSG